jgi:hypothetical protein
MKPGDAVVTKNDGAFFHIRDPGKIGMIVDRFDHAAAPWSQETEWMDWWVLVDGTIECYSSANLEVFSEAG